MGYSTVTNGVLNCHKWGTQLSQMGYSIATFGVLYRHISGTIVTYVLTM